MYASFRSARTAGAPFTRATGIRTARAPRATRTRTARTRAVCRLTAVLLGAAALLAPPAAAHAMGLPLPVPHPRSAAEGSLTVRYDDGSGNPRTYDVACDGARTRQRDMNACRRLEQLDGPLGAVQPGQMCSMIYGGPQTATVTGTWRGRAVSETYRRTNGCEVARWNRMVPALPNPANASPAPAAAGHAGLTTPPGSAQPATPPGSAQPANPATPADSTQPANPAAPPASTQPANATTPPGSTQPTDPTTTPPRSTRPAQFTVPGDGADSAGRPDFFSVPHTADTVNRAPHTT